ncbi:MAG: tetratricopeptide repeat protein [Saprospiraceae bacterium]
MKYLLLFLLFAVNQPLLTAQPALIDSLRLELRQAEGDSARAYWMGRMVWHNLRYDLDTAQYYTTQGRGLTDKLKNPVTINSFRHYQGLIHRMRNDYAAAIDTFKIILDFHQQRNDSVRVTGPLFNLGVIYSALGDYATSMKYHQQELDIRYQLGEERLVANTLNSIGNLHNNQKDFQKAHATFSKAKNIAKRLADEDHLSIIYGNLGDNFVALGQLDSAEYYARESLRLNEEMERPWGMAYAMSLLTNIYSKHELWSTALNYGERALQIRREMKQPKDIAISLCDLAEVQSKIGQTQAGIDNIKEALVISDNLGTLEIRVTAYELLANLQAQRGDYQLAYQAQQRLQMARDSLLNIEKSKAVRELEIQYQVKAKERQVVNLQQENALKASAAQQEKRSRIAWTIAAILFALLAAIATLWYRQRLYKNQLINQQKNSLQQSRIYALEQNQQLLAYAATLQAQESERQRIAKDLHDSLGSLLASIRLHFRAIQQQMPQLDTSDIYTKTKSLLQKASDEVRRISHNMMPDELRLGLTTALAELVENHNATSTIQIQLTTEGTPTTPLSEQQNIMLYRIAQELLQNAIKHAAASHISVELLYKNQQVQLCVRDDGKGFEIEKVKQGLGFRSIQSRVAAIGGKLKINTKPQFGTKTVVII